MIADRLDTVIGVITGSNGHLGRATVSRFLELGATIFAVTGHSTGNEAGSGPGLHWLTSDAASESSVRETWTSIRQRAGRVDVLINLIGGIYPWSRVEDVSLASWEQTINVNLTTAFLNMKEALRIMVSQGSGKIINVGSLAGIHGRSFAGPYGAAKAALINLTQTAADENKKNNIQINAIVPGIIDTPVNRRDMPDADFSDWVAPETVAGVLAFLASGASDGITGSVIKVTGRL